MRTLWKLSPKSQATPLGLGLLQKILSRCIPTLLAEVGKKYFEQMIDENERGQRRYTGRVELTADDLKELARPV